jgi:hypothetical protein
MLIPKYPIAPKNTPAATAYEIPRHSFDIIYYHL